MLEMASTGARVLMARSVEFGRRYNVPIIVRPTFSDGMGTTVKEQVMEQAIVSGVTHNDKEIKFTLFGVPDQPGIAGSVFGHLSDKGVNVDMIVQNVSKDSKTDISFTAPEEQKDEVMDILLHLTEDLKAEGSDKDENIARVSIIGAGMESESGVASKMFKTLGSNEINIGIFPVKALKPTGAGDAFMGSFIGGLINNKNIEESIIYGTASAAIVVTKVGCAPAMPNLEEVLEFMQTNKIN